jgi:hypothetical protein
MTLYFVHNVHKTSLLLKRWAAARADIFATFDGVDFL